MSGSSPLHVAVLDVGKTNVKLVVVEAATGRELWHRTAPNRARRNGPYPHADVGAIESFLVEALADAAGAAGVDAVSVTTHGATGALIGADGLALPVLDYEHDGPDALAAEYDALRPAFAETFSPRLPGGLNLGAQLLWQARAFPDAFAAAQAFVTYPQYWAWRLTGVAATEPTSLGCHTDLWAPGRRGFSSLVDRAGWRGLMAPVRSAFDVLGTLRPGIADRVGLGRGVPVACGIHDSNASLLPHIRGGVEPKTVVSTGTWIVVFAAGGPLARLVPGRDLLANVDAYGRPVPSARFMGGREFDLLSAGRGEEPDAATVASVLERGIMVLPTFAPGSGPFPARIGTWSGEPAMLTGPERTAAASLYAALMTAACIDLLDASGTITVEGPFARNALFLDALARATGRAVVASPDATGTAAGAAHLFATDAMNGAPASMLRDPHDRLGASFDAYAARWQDMAKIQP